MPDVTGSVTVMKVVPGELYHPRVPRSKLPFHNWIVAPRALREERRPETERMAVKHSKERARS
jgi:hypothetical protein